MNRKQLNRCIGSNSRNGHIVADIIPPAGHFVSIKMGGRRISHRRIKLAMVAAKREWPYTGVFFRYGGTLVTPEISAEWQQHTAANGYWWPKLAKWAVRAVKTATKINGKV